MAERESRTFLDRRAELVERFNKLPSELQNIIWSKLPCTDFISIHDSRDKDDRGDDNHIGYEHGYNRETKELIPNKYQYTYDNEKVESYWLRKLLDARRSPASDVRDIMVRLYGTLHDSNIGAPLSKHFYESRALLRDSFELIMSSLAMRSLTENEKDKIVEAGQFVEENKQVINEQENEGIVPLLIEESPFLRNPELRDEFCKMLSGTSLEKFRETQKPFIAIHELQKPSYKRTLALYLLKEPHNMRIQDLKSDAACNSDFVLFDCTPTLENLEAAGKTTAIVNAQWVTQFGRVLRKCAMQASPRPEDDLLRKSIRENTNVEDSILASLLINSPKREYKFFENNGHANKLTQFVFIQRAPIDAIFRKANNPETEKYELSWIIQHRIKDDTLGKKLHGVIERHIHCDDQMNDELSKVHFSAKTRTKFSTRRLRLAISRSH